MKSIVQTCSYRFVVLMDHLDDRLKSLIRFINENSRFDVYAIELELYGFDDYQVVIPRLYGAEVPKGVDQPSNRSTWDEPRFFADAKQRLDAHIFQSLRRLYEFARMNADRITWGTGTHDGSFNPKYDHVSPRKSIFTAYSNGRLRQLGHCRVALPCVVLT